MRFLFVGRPLDYKGFIGDSTNVGGSECAVYYMQQELLWQNHEVKVVDSEKGPFEPLGEEWDVLVAVRYPEILGAPVKAKKRVLWCHDVPVNHLDIKKVLDKIDHIFVLSYFHRDCLLFYLPEAVDKVWITSGGVDLDVIQPLDLVSHGPQEKIPGLVLYTSRPERGLEVLSKMKLPEGVRLEVTGYLQGRLTKWEYYERLRRAQLVLYPCTFPEIFCCSAIEAQAAGTPIVTTNDWALREVVADPVNRIQGSPFSEKYQKDFIERVEQLLSDPEEYRESQKIGIETTQKFGWDRIAKRWEEFLE